MRRFLLAVALLPILAAAAAPADHGEPYRILRQANRSLDPALAASAYAADGALIFDYPGLPVESFKGGDAIRSAYVRTFGQVDPGSAIELEFRFEPPGLDSPRHAGVYRLDASVGGRRITLYGRFEVSLVAERGRWRFAKDRGAPATAADFEQLPATSLVNP